MHGTTPRNVHHLRARFVSAQRLGRRSLCKGVHPLAVSLPQDDQHVARLLANNRAGALRSILHRVLTCMTPFSDFDVNGWLGTYPLALCSTEQFRALIRAVNAPEPRTMLDIGAGNGGVTAAFEPLLSDHNHHRRLVLTETSKAMASVLKRDGYEVWEEDLALTWRERAEDHGSFDVVSIFNVLDRCEDPVKLLKAGHSFLNDSGMLITSLPLPFTPFYYSNRGWLNRRTWEPKTNLLVGMPPESNDFETQSDFFLGTVLPNLGFKPLAFSRVPYISAGDLWQSQFTLDALVVVSCKSDSVQC